MWKVLKFFQKNLVWSIPLFIVLGLIFGYFFEAQFLKVLITPPNNYYGLSNDGFNEHESFTE